MIIYDYKTKTFKFIVKTELDSMGNENYIANDNTVYGIGKNDYFTRVDDNDIINGLNKANLVFSKQEENAEMLWTLVYDEYDELTDTYSDTIWSENIRGASVIDAWKKLVDIHQTGNMRLLASQPCFYPKDGSDEEWHDFNKKQRDFREAVGKRIYKAQKLGLMK